jgi:hypothetical protein
MWSNNNGTYNGRHYGVTAALTTNGRGGGHAAIRSNAAASSCDP